MNPALATLVAAGLAAAALPAQHLIQTKTGIQAGECYGSALAPAGDVNGDGVPDWVVGAPKNSYGTTIQHRGLVIVVSGKNGIWLANATGPRAGTRLGTAVAGVGDVNGDGYPDFAAGGPNDTAGGGAWAGYAGVWSGKDQNRLWHVTGEPQSRFGSSICSIGDVDGDGRPDVAIGAPENSNRTPFGCVYIHSGRTGASLRLLAGRYDGTAFGAAVANAGDVDGDGKDDLVVGEPRANDGGGSTGRVWLFSTRDLSMPELWHHDGVVSPARLGSAVAGGHDIDGDGVPDVLAGGAGTGTGSGVAEAVSGRTGALIRRHTRPAGSVYGFAVALLGDMNGDGRAEYAVGAPDETSAAGVTRVYDGGGAVLFSRTGGAGERCGYGLAGVGDLDGDGLADVAIGLPFADQPNTDSGKVEVRGYDLKGTTTKFGTGCRSASGAPVLDGSGTLVPGGKLQLALTQAQHSPVGMLLLSATTTQWHGLNLPYDLTPLGMTGCQLLVGMELQAPLRTGWTGTWSGSFGVPNTAAVIARTFHAQALVGDGGNAAGLVTSNGLSITIGN